MNSLMLSLLSGSGVSLSGMDCGTFLGGWRILDA